MSVVRRVPTRERSCRALGNPAPHIQVTVHDAVFGTRSFLGHLLYACSLKRSVSSSSLPPFVVLSAV